jgi:hypothetical protein
MGKFNVETMLKQLGGPVTIQSVLIDASELTPATIDAIRNATIAASVDKAFELWGPEQALTVRDLTAADMAYTNNIFVETSNASANQWNAMAFGAFTIPNATVLGIYGLKLGTVPDATIDFPPISGIRVDVGGSRVAQWATQTLHTFTSAASTTPVKPPMGVTRSPIVVGEDITVTIYEYTQTATTLYYPIWLGVAVEKQGVTLKP